MDLVHTAPELSLTPYTQIVKLEKYITANSPYRELSEHLHLAQLRLWEDLKATLTRYL